MRLAILAMMISAELFRMLKKRKILQKIAIIL